MDLQHCVHWLHLEPTHLALPGFKRSGSEGCKGASLLLLDELKPCPMLNLVVWWIGSNGYVGMVDGRIYRYFLWMMVDGG
jgi:hypothetical protein